MKGVMLAVLVCVAVAATTATAQDVSDAQIASIVVTANQVDIDAGRLAAARSATEDVKKFGEMMVTAHTGVNKSAVELVTRLGVTPQDNPTSQSLASGGKANVARLETLKGAEFVAQREEVGLPRRRPELANDRGPDVVVDGPGGAARIARRRDVGVERDEVAGARWPMHVEVRDEAVLIAAVPDQFDAAVALDETRQPGLHIAAAAALAIGGADLRREHLVE